MAQFPMLPLWTDSYLADTNHLNTIQHGAYLLMLMTAWRDPACRLPDDDKHLARITGLSRREWDKHGPVLRSFWTVDERYLYQKRLSRERERVEGRSRNAEKAANARWLNSKDSTHANASSTHRETDATISIPNSIPISKDRNSNSYLSDIETNESTLIPPLRSETYERAREIAPGWDIYEIERRWLDWSAGKVVRSPDKAFLGFLRKHVKTNHL